MGGDACLRPYKEAPPVSRGDQTLPTVASRSEGRDGKKQSPPFSGMRLQKYRNKLEKTKFLIGLFRSAEKNLFRPI